MLPIAPSGAGWSIESATRTFTPGSGNPTVPPRRSPRSGLDVIMPASDIP